MIRIQQEDYSVDDVVNALKQPGVGAVVAFSGSVRGTSRDGTPVEYVEWDVYESMARKIFETIRREALEQFGLRDAAIVHRCGRHRPGENLVLIVTASAHRKEAFQACEWIMNEIKKKAPLWKKEILTGGRERWIEG
ncbi:MAG TPA: molybdenum cofactor biosynthesis protein MoaE [bacterium]|nr:molybdenum cofactor biosynthesis protein MoaE [Candidatus Omnitrophota bacterium]HOL93918.1 molybdenum cofactor biosynthesis protein MoaE [bacterium]HPP00326.1 molybdenum cofactor biosynthesis protein MoaE [bacterium]HXK95472.1 molybdenum cofactor biosynthesis protein MoaE [bacterium]